MKITIDGHGGHLCEAHLNGSSHFEIGNTIEEAVGLLVCRYAQKCGFEIEVLPCETTAYDRSRTELPRGLS